MRFGFVRVNGGELVPACRTQTVWERLRGLLGRKEVPYGEMLWIDHCDSVHTACMQFAIDVCFATRAGTVATVHHHVVPWRMRWRPGASVVLETRAGDAERLGLKEQSKIEWVDNE